jgi:hypothetical protein
MLRIALLSVSLSGCMTNLNGRTSVESLGDVSAWPLAARNSADKPFVDACGADPGLTSRGEREIRRPPYLQQVTTRSALLLWTSATSAEVDITTPAGLPVATVTAVADRTARPRRGHQLIAHLQRLEPATLYCYQIRRGREPLTTRIGFRTAPEAGASTPIRFAAFGDSGDGGADQEAVRRQLRTVPMDLIVHVGDIAYPKGALRELESRVFAMYPELFRSLAIFPVAGNHEYRTAGAAPFREVFALPENGGPAGRERWYSFDWGDVHFVALDTERIGREQAAWLERDLSRNALPWVVVYAHRPPFSSGAHGGDASFVRWFVPILERHAVPLVLVGHEHHYERFRPRNGVTYVITGGGGRGVRPVRPSASTAFAAAVLQFVLVEIEGDTLALHAIDATGREFDQVVIRKRAASSRPGSSPPRRADP